MEIRIERCRVTIILHVPAPRKPRRIITVRTVPVNENMARWRGSENGKGGSVKVALRPLTQPENPENCLRRGLKQQ